MELAQFLAALSDDPLSLRHDVLPFCNGIISGNLDLPIQDEPIHVGRLLDSGVIFPDGFLHLYSGLTNTAFGSRVNLDQLVEKDGKLFAPMEFEESADA